MDRYLDDVREVERRIQKVEARNMSGEGRELPGAPAGVPDSFDEHVKLMFDLQALAFQVDVTRVFSFKMGRDASSRVYPESGVTKGFHPSSHHGNKPSNITEFGQINRYHVSLLPYFLKSCSRCRRRQTLLDKSLVIYGSPMGDGNVHNHKRCPLVLLGGANGQLAGNVHHRAEPARRWRTSCSRQCTRLGSPTSRSSAIRRGSFTCERVDGRAIETRRHGEDRTKLPVAAGFRRPTRVRSAECDVRSPSDVRSAKCEYGVRSAGDRSAETANDA
jgi:hypothetical protein